MNEIDLAIGEDFVVFQKIDGAAVHRMHQKMNDAIDILDDHRNVAYAEYVVPNVKSKCRIAIFPIGKGEVRVFVVAGFFYVAALTSRLKPAADASLIRKWGKWGRGNGDGKIVIYLYRKFLQTNKKIRDT